MPAILPGTGEAGLWRQVEVVSGGPGRWRAGRPPLGAALLPQALPWLPSARASTIRVTLEGAGPYPQDPLLRVTPFRGRMML